MTKLIPTALLLLLTAGCATASLVRKTYQPQKSGTVKYKNTMLEVSKSKEKATELMNDFCAPQGVSILQERNTSETTGYSANTHKYDNDNSNTQVSANQSEFTYIDFRCGGAKAR